MKRKRKHDWRKTARVHDWDYKTEIHLAELQKPEKVKITKKRIRHMAKRKI
jgi:hypothetical protein